MSHLVAPPPCRFSALDPPCGGSAVGLFSVPDGCACFPGDRRHALCAQHVATASPLGEMVLVEAYAPEALRQLGFTDYADGSPL